MITLKVNLGTIIQFQLFVLLLLLQIIQFTKTSRKTITAIKIIDAKRLIIEMIGPADDIARMRGTL